jgi:uncharacterized protein YbjT (DUF2867 family)
VFVTGGTGYIGRALIERLLARGHRVRALARASSTARLPPGTEVVTGDALDAATYRRALQKGDVFVHLVGVAKPAPWKGGAFRAVDLASVEAATDNAAAAGVSRFVYVSVAQPAPIMRAYVEARAAGETLVRALAVPATILRPWYVLGRRHWWPVILLPIYWLLGYLPQTRNAALRLGLVTHRQMLTALVRAVESDHAGVTTVAVPEIRGQRG